MKRLSEVAGQWLHNESTKSQEGENADGTLSPDEQRTVALYASSSLVYLLVALGWIRAGYKVILMS